MDREKTIAQLNDALLKLRSDIDTGLRRVLLHMRDADWEEAPKLLEDCRYILEELGKAVEVLGEITRGVGVTYNTMQAMYKEWQKSEDFTMPSSISGHVHAFVDEFLAGETDLLKVDQVVDKLEAQKVPLRVKNPKAVLASILARDQRLEKVDRGTFKKKTAVAS
jgi:hypothetical protein